MFITIALSITILFANDASASPRTQKKFKKILKTYSVIGDFTPHTTKRKLVEGTTFWQYPWELPKVMFPYIKKFGAFDSVVATRGVGKSYEHINRGRRLYLQRSFTDAKNTWLSNRVRFGTDWDYHRRNDLYIGFGFYMVGQEAEAKHGMYSNPAKLAYSNASTFLAWALSRKKHISDSVVDPLMPMGLYQLAVLYQRYGEYKKAHDIALEGLDHIEEIGATAESRAYRSGLRRILAETQIQNRVYRDAIQELDRALRQDPDPKIAAKIFARIGDIYFDLNNYELAEDMYELSLQLHEENKTLAPSHLVLQAESLFWMKKFSQSQETFQKALDTFGANKEMISPSMRPWAILRIADGYLARSYEEKTDQKTHHNLQQKALVQYAKVTHGFPDHEAAQVAKLRYTCLQFPNLKNKNIKHARKTMGTLREKKIPFIAHEISWDCEIDSYVSRESGEIIIDKVKEFLNLYPRSERSRKWVEPVRTAQANKINQYLNAGDDYETMGFYLANRETLFQKVEPRLAKKLFHMFVSFGKNEDADHLYPIFKENISTDLDHVVNVVHLAEKDQINDPESAVLDLSIPQTEEHEFLLTRVLESGKGASWIPWVFEVKKKWEKNTILLCDHLLPLLSTWPNDQKVMIRDQAVLAFADREFPTLLGDDEVCGITLLDLEIEQAIDRHDADRIAQWTQRLDWPLTPSILRIQWIAAEALLSLGRKDEAKLIWKHIAKQSVQTHEVKFAKARLRHIHTEHSSLWDH